MTRSEKSPLIAALVLSLIFPSAAFAEVGVEEALFGDIAPIPGLLTHQGRDKVPVALTTITAEEIRRSSARNLMDLLEASVPGVFPWVGYHEGDHMNIRGLVSNKEDKWLFLVDGVEMTERANMGSMFEESMWDLNDIEKIEIIRGPGSVTYGAGAIMGVVNVTTKDSAGTAPGLQTGLQYVGGYESQGIYASYGSRATQGLRTYLYASGTRTRGVLPYIQSNYGNTFAYNTRSSFYNNTHNAGVGAHNYSHSLGDYDGHPQNKVHASLRWDNTSLWFRYTSQPVNQTVSSFAPNFYSTGEVNFADEYGAQLRGANLSKWHLVLENKKFFLGDRLSLNTSLTNGSFNVVQRTFLAPNTALATSYTAPGAYFQNYSQDSLSGKMILNARLFGDKLDMAGGASYGYDRIGPSWGKTGAYFRTGDLQAQIVSDNPALGVTVGPEGFGVKRWSYLGEVNAKIHPLLNVIVSGRHDDYSLDKAITSPRLAIVSDVEGVGIFKTIAQKSYRVQTFATLKVQHMRGRATEHEVVNDLELIYTPALKGPLSVTFNPYYNDIDVLSYTYAAGAGTSKVGHLTLWGAELEALWKGDKVNWGANHTYLKQRSFHAVAGLGGNQNVSMSAFFPPTNQGSIYYQQGTALLNIGNNMRPEGNDLLRTPNHLTKMFADLKTFNESVLWHVDSMVNWGIPGNKDAVNAWKKATVGTAAEAQMNQWVAQLHEDHWFDIGVKVNASISYDKGPLQVTVFGQNLFTWGSGSHRYFITSSPQVPPLLEREPLTTGFRVAYKI